jgi:hypothetical protein
MANKYSSTGQYFFVNNCIGSFYRGILDWFGDEFYCRTNYKVIGTYEKSVEFFNKKCELGREVDTNILPSLTLDPSYDFQPEERGGRFLWQSQWQAAGLGERVFDSYKVGLDEQCVRLTPVFSRYQGSFELIWWLNSVYELLDVRTYLYQFSSGIGRIMRPKCFECFIILPDAILEHEDGNGVPVDWSNTEMTVRKITNMNKDMATMPILLNPWFKFDAISDATQKYGGDDIAEYKLSVTVNYEIELPTYVVITPHAKLKFVDLNMSMDAAYSRYGLNPIIDPNTGLAAKRSDESGEREDVPGVTTVGGAHDQLPTNLIDFTERAYYKFTEADEDDEEGWFVISNPFAPDVTDPYIKLISYEGEILYGDGWRFNADRTNIEVKIEPKENELVEFFRYQ